MRRAEINPLIQFMILGLPHVSGRGGSRRPQRFSRTFEWAGVTEGGETTISATPRPHRRSRRARPVANGPRPGPKKRKWRAFRGSGAKPAAARLKNARSHGLPLGFHQLLFQMAVIGNRNDAAYSPMVFSTASSRALQRMQYVVTGRAFRRLMEISSPHISQMP